MVEDSVAAAIRVRDKAVQLVSDHAARLGMDTFAAHVLIRAIHGIPVDDPRDSCAEVEDGRS